MRGVLDAVFYVVRGGRAWRLLPHDFPPQPTVYHYFRARRIDGTWRRLHEASRRRSRVRLGRDPQPSAGIVDSQSVKTTGVGGKGRGFDPGKEARGRKRRLLVNTEGLMMRAKVHSAGVFDRDGIKPLLELAPDRFPRLSRLWPDAGYNGRGRARTGWRVRWASRPRWCGPEAVGVGARGPRTAPEARFHGAAEEVGDREDVRVALPQQEDEQGPRKATGELGGVRPRRDDAARGRALGPLVTLFGRFLCATRPNPAIREFYGRQVAAGEPKNVAPAKPTCTRKLRTMLAAVSENRSPWRPDEVRPA